MFEPMFKPNPLPILVRLEARPDKRMLSLTIKGKGFRRSRFSFFFIENEEDRECTSFFRKVGTRFFDRGGMILVLLAGLLG